MAAIWPQDLGNGHILAVWNVLEKCKALNRRTNTPWTNVRALSIHNNIYNNSIYREKCAETISSGSSLVLTANTAA